MVFRVSAWSLRSAQSLEFTHSSGQREAEGEGCCEASSSRQDDIRGAGARAHHEHAHDEADHHGPGDAQCKPQLPCTSGSGCRFGHELSPFGSHGRETEKRDGDGGDRDDGRPSQRLERTVQQVFSEFVPESAEGRGVRGMRLGTPAELNEGLRTPPLLLDGRKTHGKVGESRRTE